MDLFLQNPWWRNPQEIEMDEKVKWALKKSPPVIFPFTCKQNTLFLGPRQVGKTTTVKLWIRFLLGQGILARNILYFSCEPLKNKTDLIELFTEFDQLTADYKGQKYIFLDEITFVSDWEQAVKYYLETSLSREKLLIATGSNALALKFGGERLPGRDLQIQLFLPLSFRQFLEFFASEDLKKALQKTHVQLESLVDFKVVQRELSPIVPFISELNSKLTIYLKTGGYLKAIHEYLEAGTILSETYETYVKWILGDLSKVGRREDIFQSIITGIIKRSRSKFSLLAFSKEMAIPSHVTTSDYINLLEGLLLVQNLYQVDIEHLVPIFRKERKVYLRDPFLFSVFSGYIYGKYQDFSSNHEDLLLESIVCDSLARIIPTTVNLSHILWFYVAQKETDFVVRVENHRVGIEVKWQNQINRADFTNFNVFQSRYLLSKQTILFEKDLMILPIGVFCAGLFKER